MDAEHGHGSWTMMASLPAPDVERILAEEESLDEALLPTDIDPALIALLLCATAEA